MAISSHFLRESDTMKPQLRILLAAGLLAAASGAAFAKGGGGPGGMGGPGGFGGGPLNGGNSAAHLSAQGIRNNNGPNAIDRDRGRARAADRRSAEGMAHFKAGQPHSRHHAHNGVRPRTGDVGRNRDSLRPPLPPGAPAPLAAPTPRLPASPPSPPAPPTPPLAPRP